MDAKLTGGDRMSGHYVKKEKRKRLMKELLSATIEFVKELSTYYGVEPPKIILIGTWYFPYYNSDIKRITLGHIYPLPLLLHEFRHHVVHAKKIREEKEYERELDAIRWSISEAPKWVERWLFAVYPLMYELK